MVLQDALHAHVAASGLRPPLSLQSGHFSDRLLLSLNRHKLAEALKGHTRDLLLLEASTFTSLQFRSATAAPRN